LSVGIEMLGNDHIDELFWATIEATEEAILNALVAAETMVGRDGITFHALPHDRLVELMRRYGRLA
ncbi:MAG: P1 family peptidase, partial [Chloroflexota bacterium]|nr:P1 family peptidase [Chloroflexota bacterium]